MKTILVPTDFSDPANNALSLAVQMAQKTQGEVILLNVIEPIKSYVAATDGMYIDASVEQKYLDYLKENAQLQMDILKDKADFAQANIRTEVSLGTIFSAIQDKVSRESVDLIVMGTQGVSGLDEILIGSNTEKVVRTAPCPVLAVKEKRDLSEFKNLLFATSLKKEQLGVLEDLQALREILGAHLHLLYVNVPNDFYTHREIYRRKEEFLAEAQLGEVSFHIYNEVNEENGILYFAEDHQMDMIVVATHQRTGLAHLISGSIAEDVVNHAKRPVLTFGLKYRHKNKA